MAHIRQLPLKRISVALAAGFSSLVLANPLDPTVVAGSATFQNAGNTLTVTNANGTVIDWKGFSIGQGEITRFIQANAASQVLNRVTSGDPSVILGALQSNGRVFLINQNGIAFGPNAQIDVGGFVVSSLGLSNADFLAGRLNFTEQAGAGNIVNQGLIRTASGGLVALIAPTIENHGIIQAPNGDVILAAGKSANLVDLQRPSIQVEVNAADNQALNVGQLVGRNIGIYAGAIRHSGIASANTAALDETGRVVFKAVGDTLVSGKVSARNEAGSGGRIEVLGDRVGLFDGADIDASGKTGGGTVLVGGDFQGKNPDVQNAQRTYVARTAKISADAIEQGDGGKVVVWADDTTVFHGSIDARGGAESGDGGNVEVSGKQNLGFTGTVATGAAKGKTGSLLLDPNDLYVGQDPSNGALLEPNADADATTFFAQTNPNDYFVLAASLAGDTNYTLQANHDVIFNANVGFGSAAGKTVLITATNNIFSTGFAITTAGGALTMNSATMSLGGIDTGAGLLTLNNSGAASQSGVFAGSGGLTKTGGGTLTLSQINTYTGTTNVTAGTLSVSDAAALNTASSVVVNGGTLDINNITLNTLAGMTVQGTGAGGVGALTGTGAGARYDGAVTLAAATTVGGGGTLTLSGIIGDGGSAYKLSKEGAGTLVLGGANSYTGLTTVSAGTLAYGAADVIATGGVTVDGASAILALGLNHSDSVGTVTVANGGSITGTGTSALTSTGSFEMQSGSVSAILAGSGIALNKTTAGTVTLSGANTYTGITTVSAGTLVVGAAAPSGSAGALGNATSAVLLGDTAGSANAALLIGGAFTVGRDVTVQAGSSGTATIGGSTANSSTFSGSVTLNKNATFTAANGGTTIFSGIISDGGAQTLTLDGANGSTINLANNVTVNALTVSATTQNISLVGREQQHRGSDDLQQHGHDDAGRPEHGQHHLYRRAGGDGGGEEHRGRDQHHQHGDGPGHDDGSGDGQRHAQRWIEHHHTGRGDAGRRQEPDAGHGRGDHHQHRQHHWQRGRGRGEPDDQHHGRGDDRRRGRRGAAGHDHHHAIRWHEL
ncbi:two-partner secretion domain-containing protein [Sulfuritalea hydrogenivorans]|uniref:two-partner secretion domain-containing protein n=1 Tax=Sulfuritalea hydrogenivorans TaxID=748811 RepID=UPI001494D6DA|nr:autotransporter-associated beta strand repeat-containing protein [Sulfuritalea hydrogenivorans]